jgi:hypothetical protein
MSNTTKYGNEALNNNKGIDNSAFGWYAEYHNTDGSCNTAVGSNSLFSNKTGSHNTAIGAGSMCNISGSLNTAVGSSALESTINATGDGNVAIGAQALYSSIGDLNTAIGTYAGINVTSGSYNTYLGANTSFDDSNANYECSTAVGYNAQIYGSNQIILGGTGLNGSYPTVIIPGDLVVKGSGGGGGGSGSTGYWNLNGSTNYINPINGYGVTGPTGSFHYLTASQGAFNYVNVKGNVDISGNLGVTGSVNVKGNVDISGNLGVTGSVNVKGDVFTNGYLDGVINNPEITYMPVDVTSNFYTNWTKVDNVGQGYWQSTAVSSTGQYQMAVDAADGSGRIYSTSSYGDIWTNVIPTTNIPFVNGSTYKSCAMSATGQYQYAVIGVNNSTNYIIFSNNYGKTYNKLPNSPNATYYTIVTSATGQYTIAYNTTNNVIYSTDYGNTWSSSETSITLTSTDGNAIAINASGTLAILIDISNLYYSTNYGKTWSINFNSTGGNQVSMSSSGQYQTLVTTVGSIYCSNNYGQSWVTSTINYPSIQPRFVNTVMSASGQYQTLVVNTTTNGINLYSSTNYGVDFNPTNNPLINYFSYAIAISANGQYQLSGDRGNGYLLKQIIPVGSSNTSIIGATGYFQTIDISPSGSITQNGSVKSFVIDHPCDNKKYLVHACLEGPEAGVYYRGEGKISNNSSTTINLPYYVDNLAKNFTVQLTQIDDIDSEEDVHLKCSRVSKNKFNVYGKNCSFYWIVYGERLEIETEPLKLTTEVKGDGPYKWISL